MTKRATMWLCLHIFIDALQTINYPHYSPHNHRKDVFVCHTNNDETQDDFYGQSKLVL